MGARYHQVHEREVADHGTGLVHPVGPSPDAVGREDFALLHVRYPETEAVVGQVVHREVLFGKPYRCPVEKKKQL